MSSGSFKNVINKMSLQILYLIHMQKQDLALNKQQWFVCHKTNLNLYGKIRAVRIGEFIR